LPSALKQTLIYNPFTATRALERLSRTRARKPQRH
jgi:hypothetical protein